jgi:hypothetical protein
MMAVGVSGRRFSQLTETPARENPRRRGQPITAVRIHQKYCLYSPKIHFPNEPWFIHHETLCCRSGHAQASRLAIGQ